MAVTRNLATRNAELDGGMGSTALNRIALFTGAPVSGAGAEVGTLLATVTFSGFSAAASGALTATGLTATTAVAGGTMGHFTAYNSGGTALTSSPTTAALDKRVTGTVTISGGGGDMTFDNNVVTNTQAVTISSLVITDGA